MNTKIFIITVLVLTAGWLMWNYWINTNPEKKNSKSLENQKGAGAEVKSRQWSVGSNEFGGIPVSILREPSREATGGIQPIENRDTVESSNGYEVLGDYQPVVQNDREEATECSETITMANVDRGVDYRKSATHYYLSTSGCGCSDIKDVSEQC